jgi:hypothetical protein
VNDVVAARSEVAAEEAMTTPQDVAFPIGSDTAFRCVIALFLVRSGMRLVSLGARCLSPVHPGHNAHKTAVEVWRDRTRQMPWRGFVPTGSLISVTQTAWFAVALVCFNVTLHVLGLPHVHMHGLLRHHVPHLSVRLVAPQ